MEFEEITQTNQVKIQHRTSSQKKKKKCENLGRLNTFLLFRNMFKLQSMLFFFFSDVVKNNSRKKTFSEFLNFRRRVCEGALSRRTAERETQSLNELISW